MHMLPIEIAFANATEQQALDTVWCGFELETQAVDGLTYNQIIQQTNEGKEPAFDSDQLRKDIDQTKIAMFNDPDWLLMAAEECNGIATAVFLYTIRHGLAPKKTIDVLDGIKMARNWLHEMKSHGMPVTWNTVVNTPGIRQLMERDGIESWINKWLMERGFRPANYRIDNKPPTLREWFQRRWPDFPMSLEVKQDGSVLGVEFATVGALNAEAFMLCLDWLYSNLQLTIDPHCSFHVNLSLPGSLRPYDPDEQQHIVSWLFDHAAEMPPCVLPRLQDDSWIGKYAAKQIDKGRYRFVAFRIHAWEFRFWGNVSNVTDGYQCLKLSVLAYQHAIQQLLRRSA